MTTETTEPIGTRIDVAGASLFVQVSGHGAPVVFLHGLGSSTRDWEHQTPHFRDHHRLILVDLFGHGRSRPSLPPLSDSATTSSPDVTMARHARDLATVLEHLGAGPAHVVGISMGAMVALQFALDHAPLTRSVVAVNTPADMRPRGLGMRLRVLQRKWLVRLLGMRRVGQILAKRLFPSEEHAGLRATFAARWAENEVPAYLAQLDAILAWHVTDRLGEIRVPVLVMASALDYTPVSAKAVIAERVPNGCLVVLDGCRHAAPVERPAPFNRALSEFLRSV